MIVHFDRIIWSDIPFAYRKRERKTLSLPNDSRQKVLLRMASKSTKKDLVQHIAKALEVSPVEAERVMLVVMRYVRRQLLEDTSVILPGIGTLAVTETAARLGRNPHTGQPVPIPPRKTIKLKVSKDLKEAMEPSETVRTGGADFDAQ